MNRFNDSKLPPDDPLLTAYALGELEGEEHARIAALVAADPTLANAVAEIRTTSARLAAALASEPLPATSPADLLLGEKTVAFRGGAEEAANRQENADTDTAAAETTESAEDTPPARRGHEPWRRRQNVRSFPYFLVTSLAAACFVVAFIVHERDHARAEAERLALAKQREELNRRFNEGTIITFVPGDDTANAGASGDTIPVIFAGENGATSGENPFHRVAPGRAAPLPLRTGTTSFANVRRSLTQGQRPARSDVRIEELLNYFPYDYIGPRASDSSPIAASLEVASAPWAPEHRLVRIGLKAREEASPAGEASSDESAHRTRTVAKDVTALVEFNPARVQAYRLIGYENRAVPEATPRESESALDPCDIASGQAITALYEVVPVGAAWKPASDAAAPEFQTPASARSEATTSAAAPRTDELLAITLHYKLPADDAQDAHARFPLVDGGASFADASPDFKFAAAVASFGMLLRDSPNRGETDFPKVLAWAGEGSRENATAPETKRRHDLVSLVTLAEKASM